MEDLISIIVPVFNVESYLDECLTSIMGQTYRNFQIILVNDGSTDRSGEICERYENNYDCVKLIHHRINLGVSMARNTGLDASDGDYISFIDPDDVVNEKFIESLLNYLKIKSVDIVLCDYSEFNQISDIKKEVNQDTSIQIDIIKKEGYMWSLSFVGYDYQHVKNITLWNKLYKSAIFENLRFDNVPIAEDDLIIHKIISKAENILYVKEPLYYYRIRQDSLTRLENRRYENIEEIAIITAFEERLIMCENDYPQIYSSMIEGYLLTLNYQFFKMKKTNQVQISVEINEIFNKDYLKYRRELSDIKRIKFWLVKQLPNLSYWFFTLFQFFFN